jgi:hypothetical protein
MRNREMASGGFYYNALIDPKRENDFVHLQSDEMFRHLHIASIHYGLTHSKSIDISTMLSQIVSHLNGGLQSET